MSMPKEIYLHDAHLALKERLNDTDVKYIRADHIEKVLQDILDEMPSKLTLPLTIAIRNIVQKALSELKS